MSNGTESCKIYLLTNIINNKIYIGQTWMNTMEDRMGHNGGGYFNSPYIYNAIKKYGHQIFKYTLLELCYTQEDADRLEVYYMDLYDSRNLDIGYNLKEGGWGGKQSEETKAKISQTLKKQADNWTPEFRAAKIALISGWWANKERGPHSEEHKQDISNTMKEWHSNNMHPMQGKTHTEEAKAKISAAGVGRKDTPETTEKRSRVRKTKEDIEKKVIESYLDGKNIGEIETIYDIGSSTIYRIIYRNNIPLQNNFSKFKGKKHTEETKSKMSSSATELWNSRKENI